MENSSTKRGRGRPRLAKDELRQHRLAVYLRGDEWGVLRGLADQLAVTPGIAARQILARALKRRQRRIGGENDG